MKRIAVEDILRSLCFVILLFPSGCGGDRGPKMATVTGTVRMDETPVSEGRIQFEDSTGLSSSAGAKIEQGRYTLQSPIAAMKVRILAYREVPGKFLEMNPGVKTPFIEQYIPANFNEATELQANIEPGTNTFDFDLTSKKAGK